MLFRIYLLALVGFWTHGTCQAQTRFQETPVDSVAIAGLTAQLNCSVADLNTIIIWSVETDGRYEQISSGIETYNETYLITGDHLQGEFHLYMANVTKRLESIYQCNVNETNLVSRANLYVLESGPSCAVSPGTIVIEAWDIAIFSCHIDLAEDAPGNLVWLQNNNEVARTINKTNTYTTALNRINNGDVFKCYFDFWTHLSCYISTMDVQYSPDVDVPDNNNPAKEGHTYSKQCNVDANPTATVQWIYNGVVVSETALLTLTNVHRDQNGSYTCHAMTTFWDGSSSSNSDTFQLDVQYSPDVTVASSANVVVEGRHYYKECIAEANPTASLQWKHDGAVVADNGLLELENISPGQSGTYECLAENNFWDGVIGSDVGSFNLDVQYPPIVQTSDDIVTRREGESVTLTCIEVDGNPGADTLGWILANGERVSGGSLQMTDLSRDMTGNYTCVAGNTYYDDYNGIGNAITYLDIHYTPSVQRSKFSTEVQAAIGLNATLVCVMDANPPPTFTWTKNGLIISETVEEMTDGTVTTSTLTIALVSESSYGDYISTASNNIPQDDKCEIKLIGRGMSSGATAGTVSGVLIGVGLFAVVGYLVYRRRKRTVKENGGDPDLEFNDIGKKNDEDTGDYENLVHTKKKNSTDTGHYQDLTHTEKQSNYAQLNRIQSNYANVDIKRYEVVHECSREHVSIGTTIGEGSFGHCRVFRAKVTNIAGRDGETIVAVKMVIDSASDDDKRRLIVELDILKSVGSHRNVVGLLGCCTETEPVYIIMEFMAHNLQKYLRDYRRAKTSTSYYANASGMSWSLTGKDLVSFAKQVANGMEYLVSKDFVHGELTARSVLLTVDKICKLSNFGLRGDRDIESKRVKEARLSIRWMAPETLKSSEYSTMSDVWSFGILLWEIVTLGNTPYPSGRTADNVKDFIMKGFRMKRPAYCDKILYSIVMRCWSENKRERPSFSQLVIELESMARSSETYIDVKRACADTPKYKKASTGREKC